MMSMRSSGISSPYQAVSSMSKRSSRWRFVYNFFYFHIFFFLVFKYDFMRYVDFTGMAASNTARLFIFLCSFCIVEIDEESSHTGGF